MEILKETGLALDDLLLVPRLSFIESRFTDSISLKTHLLDDLFLKYPLISANMDTVTGHKMAKTMEELGGLGIIHRFMSLDEHKKELLEADLDYAVACIGVNNNSLQLLEDMGIMIVAVLIDVAHGHSQNVLKTIESVRTRYPQMQVIAGNVATADGAYDLCSAGADCIKVGVGNGACCTTRINTGNGVPQATAIVECARGITRYQEMRDTYIRPTLIADGGIKNAGDIVKCLALGADAVMIGHLFAGTDETPTTTYVDTLTTKLCKTYRGQASKQAQEEYKGQATSVEGEMVSVPLRGSVRSIFQNLIYGILSGMSYQNARTIQELQRNAVFIRQTSAGFRESSPHALKRG